LKSNSRPRIVTWLAFAVLTLSILFVIRFFTSLHMPDLTLTSPKWYFSLTGFVWGASGLILCYGLYRTLPWALRMLNWGSLLFVAWYWIEWFFFVRSDYSRGSWPASLTLTVIALGVIFWIQRRTDVQEAFQENNL
jgi:hypothetical protein